MKYIYVYVYQKVEKKRHQQYSGSLFTNSDISKMVLGNMDGSSSIALGVLTAKCRLDSSAMLSNPDLISINDDELRSL